VLGEEDPDALTSKASLASMFFDQRWWKEAGELQAQEIETTQGNSGRGAYLGTELARPTWRLNSGAKADEGGGRTTSTRIETI